jgi:hypothetical protein
MFAMVFGMRFRRFRSVMRGVMEMALRDVGVVRGLLRIADVVMFSRFSVVLRCFVMVFRRFAMMVCCLLRHAFLQGDFYPSKMYCIGVTGRLIPSRFTNLPR